MAGWRILGWCQMALPRSGTPLVIHNIGAGAQEEDVLFSWRMVGHYRYFC
ncbi:DUF1287 domain-containing protein [Escherichia coli]|nr:DUF1287 domain-containing protein [Escherichia coli]